MATVTQRTLTHTFRVVDQTSGGEIVSRAGLVLSAGAALGDTANAMEIGANVVQVRKRAADHWAPITLAGLNDHRIIQECEPVGGFTKPTGNGRHFLILGQSGASGRASTGSLPSPWPPTATAPKIWTLDRQFELRLATEPLDADPTYPVDTADDEGATPVGASWATALADRVLSEDTSIDYVVVTIVAKGAQVISAFVQNTNRNTLYGQACARVKEAVRITGRPLDAVFFYQGESDFQAGDPTTWAASAQAVFDALRADLATWAIADLPIFIVKPPPTVPNTFNATWWANGRAAVDTLASASAPKQVVLNAPDGPLDAQNLHLEWGTTTTGAYGLGRIAADAFLVET